LGEDEPASLLRAEFGVLNTHNVHNGGQKTRRAMLAQRRLPRSARQGPGAGRC
jgi:hypothetical protein